MVDVFYEKFNYLRVDPELAQGVELSDQYIKFDDGKKKERNIFFNVSYDNEERNKLKEIENLALANNMNHRLFSCTGELLKFLYANQFDINNTFTNIKEHIEWVENPKTFNEDPLTIKHLKDGYIYMGGVDKFMRPTAIFNVDKIDIDSTTEDSILAAYNRIFKFIEEYQFFKSKIESWNVIIETNEIGVIKLPIKILGKIISTMQANFPSNLNRIFILNPSTSLNFSWRIIAAFINERSQKKISFLKRSELSQLLEHYDPDQLEQRFGGQAPNITQYYPPQKFQPSQKYTQKMQQRRSTIKQQQKVVNMTDLNMSISNNDYQYRQSQYQTNQGQPNYTPLDYSNTNQLKQSQRNSVTFLYQQPSLSVQSSQQPYQSSVIANQLIQPQQTIVQQRSTSTHQTNTNFAGAANSNFGNSNQFDFQGTRSVTYQIPNNAQPQLYQNNSEAYTYNYQEQNKLPETNQQQSSLTNSKQGATTLRFTKQKVDDNYIIPAKAPGFRDENINYQGDQTNSTNIVSKYSIVNNILANDRMSQINKNLLDNMEAEEDHDIVKRSKKNHEVITQEVNDPKMKHYMDNLREQNYKACSIF